MDSPFSWIAVRGLPPEEIRELLGIRITTPDEDLPEATCTACQLPDDWYLVQFSSAGAAVRHGEAVVARGAEVVFGSREPATSRCSVAAWSEGTPRWSVEVTSDRLRFEGQLPPASRQVVDQAESSSSGKVSLKLPFDAAYRIVGYHPDRMFEHEVPWDLAEILDPEPGPAHMAGAGKFGCFGMLVAGVGVLLALGR